MPSIRIRLNQISCELEYRIVKCTAPSPEQAPHVLLLHGHSSRMKEFDDLIPRLSERAHVYTFDQPCCGASSDVSAARVAARYRRVGRPAALYYLRELTSEFVHRVVVPNLPGPRSLRVAGGSLGGNLALWLTERGYTWLKDAVVWSPGSAWRGDLFQTLGAPAALGRAKLAWGSRRRQFLEDTFCKNLVDVLGIPGLTRPQPWYWYWDGWGGGARDTRPRFPPLEGAPLDAGDRYPKMTAKKASAIAGALHELAHDYTGARASWHWQLAGEQLGSSHRDRIKLPNGPVVPRIALLKANVLFMAGAHDNSDPANLHRYTKELYDEAAKHVKPPLSVRWRSIAGSGHSIHNERPELLADLLSEPSVA